MKKHAVVYTLFLVFLVLCSSDVKAHGATFDTLQFRTPYSLNECLHDGLVSVESSLLDAMHAHNSVLSSLESVNTVLLELQDNFDMMIDRSNVHAVHRGDREFLQSMIDRIDKMIQSLEENSNLSDQEVDAVHRSAQTLQDLNDKLST